MIDIRKLKELVRLMVANELTEVDLRDSEEQVTLRRHTVAHAVVPTPAIVAAPHATAPASSPAGGHAEAGGAPVATAEDDGLLTIESPMVGTFYSAPDPDSPPYVTVGSSVAPDTVVCIMEAMKIFNEIRAECSGTVQKLLVKSGEPVEFGQPLFLVKPS
jgi:acetyl-CoA carboxylase biotin carboxyl carrier protein